MKREANRDRETFGGAWRGLARRWRVAVAEKGREMDEREVEQEQEVEKVWTKGK